MSEIKHPQFATSEDGRVQVSEGEFKGSIYKYKGTDIDENKTLKYDIDLHKMILDGEDVTTDFTEHNEAKFLNTVTTPILTRIIESLQQLEAEAKKKTEDEIVE